MDDAVKEQLARFVDLWNSTEKITKQAELISVALIRPSINELRYAGRWMVSALNAILKDQKQIDKLTTVDNALSYAILCCLQAKHDAIDSIILYLHEKIDDLNEHYSSHTISLYVQDYDHFLKEVSTVDRMITTSRSERENRVELYDSIFKDHLPKLMDFLERIRNAETVINQALADEAAKEQAEKEAREEVVRNLEKLLGEAQRSSRSARRGFWISVGFNVVLVILAIITIIPLVPAWQHPAANTPSTGATQDGVQPPKR